MTMAISIIASGLACLTAARLADGQPMKRTLLVRNETMPSTSTASQSASNHNAKLIAAIVVPVVLTLLVGAIVFSLRRKLRNARPPQVLSASSETAEQTLSSPPSRQGPTMAQRFGVWCANLMQQQDSARYGVDAETDPVGPEASTGDSRSSRARRHGRRNGARSGLRRTESGATVKTLPEYKISPAENELMLYKADASPSELELSEVDTPDMVHYQTQLLDRQGSTANSERVHALVQTVGDAQQDDGAPTQHASIASIAASGLSTLRRSLRRSVGGRSNAVYSPATDPETTAGNELENLNDAIAPHSSNDAPDDATPTYDSLYPTISIEDVREDTMRVSGGASPTATVPTQASRSPRAFRNIFRRPPAFARTITQPGNAALQSSQRFVSTASVLNSTMEIGSGDARTPSLMSNDADSLQLVSTRSSNDVSLYRPNTAQSTRRTLNPFPRIHVNGSSVSLLPSGASLDQSSNGGHDGGANTSNAPVMSHRRNISAPISIRRLQFEPPAAGFTEQQMTFLASVESLDRYGVPLGGDMDDATMGSRSALPSFEQLARHQERLERQRQVQLQQQSMLGGGSTTDLPSTKPAIVLTSGEVYQRQQQLSEHTHQADQQPDSNVPLDHVQAHTSQNFDRQTDQEQSSVQTNAVATDDPLNDPQR